MLVQLKLSDVVMKLLQIITIMVFSGQYGVLGDCRYHLNEQPSNMMTCNPYLSGRFTTRCVVQFSTTEGAPLRLAWYSRAQLGGTSQRIFSGFVTKNTASSVESELIISIKDTVTMCDGFSAYYCQVSFYNGTLLSKSREIYLFPRYAFSNALKMCDEWNIQSTHTTECVDPQFLTAEQTTTFLPILETTSSESLIMAATTQQTTINPPLESSTLPPSTSVATVTTETVLTTTGEHSSSTTENSPATETLLTTTTAPPMTEVAMTTTDDLPLTISNSQPSITTSLSIDTEPYSVTTSESQPAMATHTPATEASPQTTKGSPSTTSTEVPPATTMSSPLATKYSPATSESVTTLTISNSTPLIPTTQDSQSGSQTVSTDPPSNSPQSPPPMQTPSPPTNPKEQAAEPEVGSDGGFDDTALIFLTLGAAVFLLILICCIMACLCLWSDSCRQCGYEICCSDESCCTCSCCLCLDDV